MSILETFYILFKGDNTDIKKSVKETEKTLDGLKTTTANTFEKTDKAIHKTSRSFLELARAAAAFVGASAAAYTVLNKVLGASKEAGELGNISRILNVNVRDLDAWSQAVQRTGGSAAGFQNSLRSLSQHLGTSAAVTLKALPQLADTFKRLGGYRAQYYGKLLGIDEATILLLQQGRREVESIIKQTKELSSVTEKDVEIANRHTEAQLKLSLAFRGLYLTLAQDTVPILTKMYEKLVPVVEYIKDHKDLIVGAFIGIGIAAAIMFIPFELATLTILAVGAAIATLIGLFAIAYEDIKAYIQGNQSLTGDILKRWSNVKTLFEDVFAILKKISDLAFPALTFPLKAVEYLGEKLNIGGSRDNVNRGQLLINQANTSPVGFQSGAARFAAGQFARNANINIGDVIINTQATDAVGIAADFQKELMSKHLWQAINNFGDGVMK